MYGHLRQIDPISGDLCLSIHMGVPLAFDSDFRTDLRSRRCSEEGSYMYMSIPIVSLAKNIS